MIIYTLADPLSKEIRYVGLTTRSLKERFYQHCNAKSNSYKYNWIKKLKKKNLKPVIEILDTAENIEELRELEIYWIEQLKHWGFKLVNLTQGGQGSFGYKHTAESIIKMKAIIASRPKKPPVKRMTKKEQYNLLSKNLSKKVIEYSLNGDIIKIWNSRLEAALFYNIRPSAIGHALKDTTRSCNNSLWRDFTEEYSEKISPYSYTGNKIKTFVYDLLQKETYVFDSLSEAFKVTGRPTNVQLFINKNKLFKKRYIFKQC